MQNEKTEVVIFQPNLDNRKDLAKLLPISKFIIRFTSTFEETMGEIKVRVPHILIISLDEKKLIYTDVVNQLNHQAAKETIIVGLSENTKAKKHTALFKEGLQEIWELPIAGLKVKPRINEINDNLKPIQVNFSEPRALISKVEGEVIAMGEAEFIAQFPLKLSLGDHLEVESTFLKDILENEEKTFVVTENRHGNLVEDQVTVTILGLKNSNLKNIRSKILNWEKL